LEDAGLRPEMMVGAVVGLEVDVMGGTLLARGSGEVTLDVPFDAGCIWPLAVVSLFVKDEIAQSAHEEPSFGTGVPMRGVVPPAVAAPGGG
jgi:hypothetical protein